MSLITRRIKAKDIGLPKWAKKALKERGLKENEVEVYRKGISPEDTKVNKSERSTVDYITTKAVDRDGDIVVPKGAILDHYRKNPVVLFGHNYTELPIGRSLWIKADEKGLISKTQYAKHQKAEEIYQYRAEGFPMAKSIGFIPLSVIEEKDFPETDLKALDLTPEDIKGASRIYPEWLMLEYSDVPVPSNPEALQLAISKGIITVEEIQDADKRKAIVLDIISDEPEPSEDCPICLEEEGNLKQEDEHKDTQVEDRKDMLDKRYGDDIVIKIVVDEEESPEEEIEDDLDLLVEKDSEWPKFTKVKGVNERWNTSLSKVFDVEGLDAEPSTVMYDIASKWLECRVRDMYVHSRSVPSAMMGNFLSGLEHSLSEFEIISSRNFENDGSESPLTYEVIQLTSDSSRDFLIDGMCFYKKEDERLILRRFPTYYGIEICAFSTFEDRDSSTKVFSDTEKWIKENNLLKGEKFSLSGEFIKKTNDTWDSLFLDEKNSKSIKSTVALLNKKQVELNNRGIILMGPPGTGKTLSGRIIMNDADATFIWVSARDFVYSGSIGGIRYGFKMARELAPSILFIEDIDHWLDNWSCDLMKTEMDGLAQHKGVVTILTSNYPEMLPPALIDRPGRFHDVLNFDLPDATIRMKMLKSWAPSVQEKTASDVIDETVGFSGAHMYELVEFAKGISEEEEIDINSALLMSLNKIKEQRELINSLRKKSSEEIERSGFVHVGKDLDDADAAITTWTYSSDDLREIEKAGRVLSKKTRGIISDAISAMEKASIALNELVETADFKADEDEPGVVADLDEKSNEGIVLKINESEAKNLKLVGEDNYVFNVDKEALTKSITDAFSELLRDRKADVGNMIKEQLDRRNGKIF